MDSVELRKFAGAFLGALLLAVGLHGLSGAIMPGSKPAKPVYLILPAGKAPAGGVAPAGPAAATAAAPMPAAPMPAAPTQAAATIEQRLAAADAKKGFAGIKTCQSCHSFEKGGGARTGPPLYGVAGRAKGSIKGFAYSQAIRSKGGTWSDADLDRFLANPKAYAQGTKMTFAGESDPAKRADIIAFLHTLSGNSRPFAAK